MTPRFALITAALGGMLLTALLGCVIVPLLRWLRCGQTVRDNGPGWHKSKNGTPTMGGFMFIAGSLMALAVAWAALERDMPEAVPGGWRMGAKGLQIALGFALLNGVIGFVDDLLKVTRRRNLGLRVHMKLVLQLAAAVWLLWMLQKNAMFTSWVQLPVFGLVDLGRAAAPLSLLLMVLLVNAVNLTDGVDGLAGSVTFVALLGLLTVASLLGWFELSMLAAALAGGCAGFLFWNFNPAKVFMGDTGSMFLGGAVTALGFCMGRPELLLLLGAVYLLEAASVVLQVVWFKATRGKRLLKMSPLHHHLELCGWSENVITAFFCGIAVAGMLLCFVFVYMYG